MRRFFLLVLTLATSFAAFGQPARQTIYLYPEGPAESNGLEGREVTIEGGRVCDVSNPRMEVFLPAEPNGQVVVLCPGGGYARLAVVHEGELFAEWLGQRGITAVVLYYRMPNGHSDIPRKDVLTAVEIVRSRAAEWGVDPAKVGVMGFSAGGHVAATALTKYTSEQNRPDFGVLIYPVITMKEAYTHGGSRTRLIGEKPKYPKVLEWSLEEWVTPKTPTCFIALSNDDRSVPTGNSTLFYDALCANKVPAELHIYPKGGHGWGFNGEKFAPYREEFLTSLERWLAEQK
ncbi:MAG: alpha/beta hydrolase [Tidjanibacter sp.]|nr:alpha/beta hydrolase [Tidjanibacter sp.]